MVETNPIKIEDAFKKESALLIDLPLLNVYDEKTQGTHGGTFTKGAWRTRDLNTVETNTIIGASLSSNQIILPLGIYYSAFKAPVASNAASDTVHQARLYNITDAVTIEYGTSASVVKEGANFSFGETKFTLGGTKTLELQHQIDPTRNTIGFGVASDFAPEKYATLQIWRLGD